MRHTNHKKVSFKTKFIGHYKIQKNMKSNLSNTLFIITLFIPIIVLGQKELEISSPNNSIKATIKTSDKIEFHIEFDGEEILTISELSLKLKSGETIGNNPKITSVKTETRTSEIFPINYKRNKITDHHNLLTIKFKKNYTLEIKAYNDGIAYRFITTRKKDFIILDEPLKIEFKNDYKSWLAYSRGEKNKLSSSFQSEYHETTISKAKKGEYAFLPILVDLGNNKKLCFTEVNLNSYPGMFLKGEDEKSLSSTYANYPKSEELDPIRQQLMVKEYDNFIAKVKGHKTFPWRVFSFSKNDVDIVNSDLVYKLATPSKTDDFSWVKPGKIAWDWWSDWNISNVNFKAGINTETYKYYIDFAAQNKLEYVVLDEGWSPPAEGNIFKIAPKINLDEIVSYGNKKGVSIILWAVWNVINEEAEKACKYYSSKGIKGFKIDFIDRNDQKAVEFTSNFAKIAAKYKLIVDYHGMFQPAGLQRTYPNILNFEGVYGLEEVKWSNPNMPKYNTTFPFIRMFAGPVDYTPGAFNNATKENFRTIYSSPMGQGTRCNQMALFIIQDAPLVALADSPTVYKKEQECTSFIASVPTTWDESIAIDGKVGEYIMTARKSGNTWYVGGITNWDERSLEVNLDFLAEGNYKAIIFKDGLNAGKIATDYKVEEKNLSKKDKLILNLSSGGGFVIKLIKINH